MCSDLLIDKILEGNAQYLFLCNSRKSGVSRGCVTFPRITGKNPNKDIFRRLELISKILGFVQIFNVREGTTHIFQYLKISARKSTKKTIFLAYSGLSGPLKANYS